MTGVECSSVPRADLIDEPLCACMQKKMDGDDEATPPLLARLVRGVPAICPRSNSSRRGEQQGSAAR